MAAERLPLFSRLTDGPPPAVVAELLARAEAGELPLEGVTREEIEEALARPHLDDPFRPPLVNVLIWAFCSPVLRVGKSRVQRALSETVRRSLRSQRKAVRAAAAATARIQAWNHGRETLGTGFLVKGLGRKRFLVTTSQVVREFAFARDSAGQRWQRRRRGGRRLLVAANFGSLKGGGGRDQIARIQEVVYAEADLEAGHDLAVLRLDDTGMDVPLPPPLRLQRAAPAAGEQLFLTGFPDPLLVAQNRAVPVRLRNALKPTDDQEQLQPGRVVRVEEEVLYHDATTRAGNAGSPVVSLETGQVIGVHSTSGEQSHAGVAVPAAHLAELLSVIRASVEAIAAAGV